MIYIVFKLVNVILCCIIDKSLCNISIKILLYLSISRDLNPETFFYVLYKNKPRNFFLCVIFDTQYKNQYKGVTFFGKAFENLF
jgi:hypothetical protein